VARSGDTQGRQLNLLNKQIFLRSSPLRSVSRLRFAALEMTKEAHLLIRRRIIHYAKELSAPDGGDDLLLLLTAEGTNGAGYLSPQ